MGWYVSLIYFTVQGFILNLYFSFLGSTRCVNALQSDCVVNQFVYLVYTHSSIILLFAHILLHARSRFQQRIERTYQIYESNIKKACSLHSTAHGDTLGIKTDNCILIMEPCVEMWLYFMKCRWENAIECNARNIQLTESKRSDRS